MYYPYGENKGADQLRSYCTADLRLCFAYTKSRFSHNEAQMKITFIKHGHDCIFSKIDKMKVLKTGGSLMLVESIEHSASLTSLENLYLVFFLSGCIRQV